MSVFLPGPKWKWDDLGSAKSLVSSVDGTVFVSAQLYHLCIEKGQKSGSPSPQAAMISTRRRISLWATIKVKAATLSSLILA